MHQDPILNQHCFYSLESRSEEDDGGEKRLKRRGDIILPFLTEEKQDNSDSIKIFKMISEESPIVSNQLLFYQE